MAEPMDKPQKKIVEHPERNPTLGFDTRTHIKDSATGQLIRKQIHSLHIVGGQYLYEYPVKSGNLFYASGEVAGRWIKDGKGYKQDPDAKHLDFVAPKTDFVTPEEVMNENEMLRAELAALKGDKEKKAAAPQVVANKN